MPQLINLGLSHACSCKQLPTFFNGAFHRLYDVDAPDLTKSKTTL